MRLKELQQIYDLFYGQDPHPRGFADVQLSSEDDTCIPHLQVEESVFFQFYNSDEFEAIKQDFQEHYELLCEQDEI